MSLMWMQARKRGGIGSRTPSKAPWHEVVYIGKTKGKQGGSYYYLVLVCGHLAIRPCIEPAAYRLFRRMPGAPKKCRCSSCGAGVKPINPDTWIDTIQRLGYDP